MSGRTWSAAALSAALVVGTGGGVGATPATVAEGISLVGSVPAPGAVSGRVVTDHGRPRWLYVSTAVSLIVFDISTPAAPHEVGRLPMTTYQNEDVDGDANIALLADDVPVSAPGSPVGGQVVIASIGDKGRPTPLSVTSLPDGAGHTASCLNACAWAYASEGASLVAIDLRVPAEPTVTRVPLPAASGYVHDVDQDADGVVWLAGSAGLTAIAVGPITTLGPRVQSLSAAATPTRPVVLTSTGPAGNTPAIRAGILHGSSRPMDIAYRGQGLGRGDVLLAGEEGTATDCHDGGRFHTFDARGLRNGSPLRLLDSVAPSGVTAAQLAGPGSGCSAHWFTTAGSLAAVAWYGAGLRILDVTNPGRIRQVARYVPQEPRTWSAYWVPGTRYVYALDLDRGIDVLEVTARPGGPEVVPLDHGTRSVSVGTVTAASVCRP